MNELVELLQNRVRKNRRRFKSIRKVTSCYRIYDRDIPEIPLVLDVYGEHLHAIWYEGREAFKNVDQILTNLVHALSEILEIKTENMFIKKRARRVRGEVVARQDFLNERISIDELGCQYWVNLQDFIDTGLFLDHRNWRQELLKSSENLKVLNLFCYTGSLSVASAKGGAAVVDSVDLSGRYLEWAEDNFDLNAIERRPHSFIQADVSAFLRDSRDQSYDRIICDPPTSSSSTKFEGDFDIQVDHVLIIEECIRCLKSGGEIWFSTNSKNFHLDDRFYDMGFFETTHKSMAMDFKNSKSHLSFRWTKSS